MLFPKVNFKVALTGIWSFPDQLNMLRGRDLGTTIQFKMTETETSSRSAKRRHWGKRGERRKAKIKKYLLGIVFLYTHYNHHHHLTKQEYFPLS